MTTWNHIIGDEKDFEGAPDWCKQVIKDCTDDIGYEENHTGNQLEGDRLWWPSETKSSDCYKLKSSDVNENIGVVIVAQREPVKNDTVNHPSHYTQGGIECIDAITAALGEEQYEGYLRGACIKYLWRYKMKSGVESLKKSEWYLKRLIELNEEIESRNK